MFISSAASRWRIPSRCSRRSARRSAGASNASPTARPANAATGSPGSSRCSRQVPALQKSGEFFRVHATGTGRERYTLKPGRKPEDVHFENLHYADFAKESFAVFKRLKTAGKIAPETRFQIDLVPAHSVIWLYLVDALHAPIDPIYNQAVKREIDKIAAALPHDQIAIQFDVASAVFARLERNQASSYGRSRRRRRKRSATSWSISATTCRAASTCCSISVTATPATSTWLSRPIWPTWSSSRTA